MSSNQHPSGVAVRLVEIDSDDRVDRLPVACVIFTHADPALTQAIDDAVCKPPLPLRDDRLSRQRYRMR